MRYAVDLRSITAGTGRFARTYLRHDPMPEHEASHLLKETASA
jgi:elongation factor G